jgi:membrane protease YdiL (CAAX protease family)
LLITATPILEVFEGCDRHDLWIGGNQPARRLFVSMWLVSGEAFTATAGVDSLLRGGQGFSFFLVGLLEESKFRGFLQFTLFHGIGFWPAAIVLSVTFSLLHLGNAGEILVGLIEVALHGIRYAAAAGYTKSLWWSLGFHAAWDWCQSFMYGTPDSGMVSGTLPLDVRYGFCPLEWRYDRSRRKLA